MLAARARAQVVIDIPVRNLFERTADVGITPVLFDSQRRIVATSRPDPEELLGTVIEDSWASDALALTGTQAYSVA